MTRKPVGIELFSGCGGMSTGFLDAGVRIVAGFDIDRRSIEAYEYNHGHRGSRGFVADLSGARGEDLLARAGVSKVDVLIGGPPCQPFSIVGKRGGADDARSGLVQDFLRLAIELEPEAVLFENVPNLASMDGGIHLELLTCGLVAAGYGVTAEVVAAADYGVAQVRRRLVLTAIRGKSKPRLPQPTHAPASALDMRSYVTSREAIGDLPPAGDFGECGIYNHEPTAHSQDMLARFATLESGRREKRSFHDRLHPDRPSYTLRAGTGNFSPLRPVHYGYDRVITVRESARLQSFSDDFIWPDWIPRLQQYRQVGNAVPPLLAAACARSIGSQVGWRLDPHGCEGDPSSRPNAITMTDDERRARRFSRLRGASLGNVRRSTPFSAR